jgi:Uma2 family endonuclease
MAMPHTARAWTIEELQRLPDDGNKYELVEGELFVTPAPNETHETILARLHQLLVPYVAANDLGAVYRPRAVVRTRGSEVEPDLMVRAERMRPKTSWEKAPLPILVVEVASDSTRRRDYGPKRDWYMKIGVAEYWIVDGDACEITVVRQRAKARVESETIEWRPRGAGRSLRISLADLFADTD